MSGPLVWWGNRKSRIGVTPKALKPPHVHGKEWWTTPPVSPPQPEHIEYAAQFLRQLEATKTGGRYRNAMLGYVSDWLRAARQLLHESVESQDGDLHTTDGLLIAAQQMLHSVFSALVGASVEIRPRWREIQQAIDARANRVIRDRAMTSNWRAATRHGERR